MKLTIEIMDVNQVQSVYILDRIAGAFEGELSSAEPMPRLVYKLEEDKNPFYYPTCAPQIQPESGSLLQSYLNRKENAKE